MSRENGFRVYIGLGSNLDEPQQQLASAFEHLAKIPESCNLKVSPLYRSHPLGSQDQPDYINAVAQLTTQLEAEALLDQLQAIEKAHGRRRDGERWGARTLDLDLLLYADHIINNERLMVPHPGLPERAFVLVPLADLARHSLVVPGFGVLQELLSKVDISELESVG